MKVSELNPMSRRVELVVKVVEKGEVRDVTSRKNNATYKVCDTLVGDDTGVISMTLWNDDISKVEAGKTYKISNGYVSVFKNKMQLNTGKYGTLEEVEEEVNVNTSNNVSNKEVEQKSFGFNY
jgi:replication factor A1